MRGMAVARIFKWIDEVTFAPGKTVTALALGWPLAIDTLTIFAI